MAVLSLRMSDTELNLVKEYAKIHNINISSFVRNLILDKLCDDIGADEEKRIYNLWQEGKNQPTYKAQEVFDELGI